MRVGAIELRVVKGVRPTGRKQRLGRVCFDDNGKMCFFMGYCTSCNSKLVASRGDAEKLVSCIGSERKKPLNRFILRQMRKHSL